VRASVLSASAVGILLLAGSPGQAQVAATSSSQFAPLPSPGFIPPYEIARTVRRSGFDPLAPPLREGSTYVVRATDFRGILMRIVVDARSGAIRDVNRIVPGPGSYGQTAGMIPYGAEPDDLPRPYGQPADYDLPPAPLENGQANGQGLGQIPAQPRPSAAHPLTHASVTIVPPLPRPRPPELASRTPIEEDAKPSVAKPTAVSDSKPDKPAADAKSSAKGEGKPQEKSQEKSPEKLDVTGSAPVAASAVATPPAAAAPSAPPATAAAKPGKSLAPPPIND
jgi:hypothetical protein